MATGLTTFLTVHLLTSHYPNSTLHTFSSIECFHLPTLGSNVGTVSNQEGNFSLSFPEPVDSILISHINYGKVSIKVDVGSSETQIFLLKQKVTELEDVVVTNIPVNEILYRAIQKSKQDLSSPLFLDTYYREFVKTNDSYTKFSDGILTYRLENKKNLKSTVWVKDSRAIELYDESEEEMDWDLTSQLDVRKAFDPIDVKNIGNFKILENVDKYSFDLSILKRKDLKDSLQIIEITPKSNIDEPLFEGKVVINPTSNRITELEYRIPASHIQFTKEANVLILKAKLLGDRMKIVFTDDGDHYCPAYLLKEVNVRVWNKNIDDTFVFLSDVIVTDMITETEVPEEKLRYKKKSLYKREKPTKTQFWLGNNSLQLTKEQEKIINSMEKAN